MQLLGLRVKKIGYIYIQQNKLYKDFNVLDINNLYIKIITIYLKKHNQLSPISHEVNTRQ